MDSKNEIKKGTLKRLLGYITKRYKKQFILVMICVIFSSIASTAGSLFLQILIDDYITPLIGIENPVFTSLLKALGILAIIYIIGILSSYIYNRTMAVIAQGIMRDIRNEMFEKMEKLPIEYFDTNSHGDIMSYYTNDTDTLRQMLSQGIPQLLSAVFSIITIIASMIYLNRILTLCVFICTILIVLITSKIAKRSSIYFVKQQKSLGKMNGYIEEMLMGEKVIKVFNHEKISENEFDEINNELNNDMYNANNYSNILMPIANNLGNLQYVLIAIIASAIAISKNVNLTLGAVVSFLQLTKSFIQPINQVMNMMSNYTMALAGASRIFSFLDEKEEQDEGYVTLVNVKMLPKKDKNEKEEKFIETDENTGMWAWKHKHHDGRVDYVKLEGKIEFENVNFGYVEGKQILYDINLYAKPGQKIAFVGSTGAGKTTITNLLNRFYDIKDGKIRFDGININKIKKEDLRKSLGMVLQDTCLFTGTIKDNIKYGKENATDEEIIEAAKLANADSFIRRLPNGYDTIITGNGQELSQGQRQLIAIARCAVSNPPVMILDEATSSIDTRTEKIIQDGLDKIMNGRTTFVIAHRLSTVKNSKAIMVMSNGHIIERGTHEDLIKQKGEYYQLYTGALELE